MPKVKLIYNKQKYVVSAKDVYFIHNKFSHALLHLSIIFEKSNYYNQRIIFYQKCKLGKIKQKHLDDLVKELARQPPMPFA